MTLHLLRDEIHPVRQVMSEYANGSHGIVMTFVFYAFGVSALALGYRLSRTRERRRSMRAVPWLLGLGGISLIAAGVFEVERPLVPDTIEEVIHSNATIVAFVLVIAAMVVLSYAARSEPRWRSFRWISLALTIVAALAAMGGPLTADTGWSGAVQRVLGFSVLSWLLLTALHVRTKAFRSA